MVPRGAKALGAKLASPGSAHPPQQGRQLGWVRSGDAADLLRSCLAELGSGARCAQSQVRNCVSTAVFQSIVAVPHLLVRHLQSSFYTPGMSSGSRSASLQLDAVMQTECNCNKTRQ